VENEIDRLARQVAEAADAWLRDPLDAGVYARLVRATLDWRTAIRTSGDPAQPLPAAETEAGVDDDSVVQLDAGPVERRPHRLDMLLGGFADELRARTVTQSVEATEPTPEPEPT